jgi:hypothetical protein
MKQFSSCGGKSLSIFMLLALCSPTSQYLTVVRFAWVWAHSDTYKLADDAPQNHLQNGWLLPEVCPYTFSSLSTIQTCDFPF